MKNVLFLLQIIAVFQNPINSSYTTSSKGEAESEEKKKINTKWTAKMQNALFEICRNTPSKESHYLEKTKKRWRELHPNYNVSDSTLLRKLYEIPHEITGRAKRQKRNFKWDKETTDELVDIYLNSRPYNESHPIALHEEWKRRHPDSLNFEAGYLATRARKDLYRRSQYVKGESSRRFFEWTNKQDSDLYHVYHVTLPEGRQQPIHMHRIWTDLHPNYRELTYDQLAERVKYLQRKPPDEHFPWTKGQNKELLDIYHSTSPEIANQGQRIHDMWSKIHPRYKFMTPYYLQIHASTLAHPEKTKNGHKKKYRKFTDEQEANLVDMYQRLMERNKPLYDFHKAWVREYPALAHITLPSLRKRARRLTIKDEVSQVGASEGGSLSGNIQPGRCMYKYTPEEKAQLLASYRQTYPRELECDNRSQDEWIQRNKNAADVNSTSLKRLIKEWKREDSDRKGKAPMVIPKVEAESKSLSNISESSE